ncbi:sulfatase/phosphatase domain-containing protein [Verrucomicrobium spinosum]|uniref:sulfatase/phosphatase domain-containing protein n=1 Tax=Verrucomicrobium spinosum TaxID=2736 RepID=UPI0012E21811|nr:sulfatase/phosphatase domain-containing protein [Verrucomicrobium spinosum]
MPFIISAPGAARNGTAIETPTELLDLYPTLADLFALQAPAYLDGKSLAPLLDGTAVSVKSAAFTEVRRGKMTGYAVRTFMYRYIEWGKNGADGVQLYDMEGDPQQTRNLAGDPKYSEARAEMHGMIQENWPE